LRVALLPAVLQNHRSVAYIFSGSHETMRRNMVSDPSRAVYQMGRLHHLPSIPEVAFNSFIAELA